VVSATDGVVEWVSRVDRWEPKADDPATRGGVSVAVIGDDGVRYYGSHLLDVGPGISPGVRVEAGAPLGHVDSTGDAEGIAAHLHFGISHPTTPDDWRVRRGEVSPYRYLNAWKQARAVTPDVPGARQASCVVSAG
jgi:murein DD-endopeptidase MepM/ murein hydrolase activator NlpD